MMPVADTFRHRHTGDKGKIYHSPLQDRQGQPTSGTPSSFSMPRKLPDGLRHRRIIGIHSLMLFRRFSMPGQSRRSDCGCYRTRGTPAGNSPGILLLLRLKTLHCSAEIPEPPYALRSASEWNCSRIIRSRKPRSSGMPSPRRSTAFGSSHCSTSARLIVDPFRYD